MRGAKKNKPTGKAHVYVEIMQNGQTLASTAKAVSRRGRLQLTGGVKGELALPLYPLHRNITVVECKGDTAYLCVEEPWEGFVTSRGEVIELSRSDRSMRLIPLATGDYASLVLNGLRLILRVHRGKPSGEPLVRRGLNYAGALSALLLGDRSEIRSLAIGAMAAAILFAGGLSGLLMRPDERPKTFSDLNPDYTLPFINPQHLALSPEALQYNLDRANFIASTVNYYDDFAAMILGPLAMRNTNRPWLVFESSRDLFAKAYGDAENELAAKADAQNEADAKLQQEQGTSVLAIPTVEGESLRAALVRLDDKLKELHDGLATNLQSRREVTQAFSDDPAFEFNKYTNIQAANRRLAAYTGQFFKDESDEAIMYRDAARLAAKAANLQARHSPTDALDAQAAAPIAIPAGVNFASFLTTKNLSQLDAKFADLEASEFGKPKPAKIREPLIGEIEPQLIDKVIKTHRFELQLCFELALRRNPMASGSMSWSWRIDSRGVISDLALQNTTIPDRNMADCVRRKIASWTFPRPRRGSVEVHYPFDFRPAKG